MRLLLDTHIFLWYVSADPRLPIAFRDAIRDPSNQVFLSVASIWEAAIKYALGKLPLPAPPEEYLPRQRVAHQVATLSIDEEAFSYLARLPALHRDPLDRILIAQALQHGLTLVTVDDAVRAYPITTLPTA
jgi:PIN domain nuclease of toxin-antitoxin system